MKIIIGQEMYRKWVPEDASLYHQPAWMDLFSPDWSAMSGLTKDNKPLWMWPYQRATRYGIKKYDRIPFCAGNGPVFPDGRPSCIFNPTFPHWMSIYVLEDRDGVLDGNRMASSGWQRKDRYFQYFDLAEYPTGFDVLSRSKRKRMRKNPTLEFVQFEKVSEASDIILPFLVSQGWKNMTVDKLQDWSDTLDRAFDHFIFGVLDPGGNLHAVQWLVGYRQTIYGWLALRHKDHRDDNSREWLLWNIIQWARERYDVYDLGGSTMSGVRTFNLEMGADERRYFRYVRYQPGALAVLHRIF